MTDHPKTAQPLLRQSPHRRYNPLRGDWVLVSAHRNKRPWQGQTEASEQPPQQPHDPECYLCAGVTRANGQQNPNFTGPYVFSNDFPALTDEDVLPDEHEDPLFRTMSVRGEARVICFSQRHDLTFAMMPISGIRAVVDTWAVQYEELLHRYEWVAVFENKGSMMGCSNPHPHGQIWASNFVPSEVAREDSTQSAYFAAHETPLLVDYAQAEATHGVRVVDENSHWICVVPFWATWPFETLLLPKQQISRFSELSEDERQDLAHILQSITQRYNALFDTEFPYSMGWHPAPGRNHPSPHWQLHAHFYPPLLRSATVRKFLVGYELLAEGQRDLTPETAAEMLRAKAV